MLRIMQIYLSALSEPWKAGTLGGGFVSFGARPYSSLELWSVAALVSATNMAWESDHWIVGLIGGLLGHRCPALKRFAQASSTYCRWSLVAGRTCWQLGKIGCGRDSRCRRLVFSLTARSRSWTAVVVAQEQTDHNAQSTILLRTSVHGRSHG